MIKKIFRKNDIRGVFKKDFDEDFAYHIGKAFVFLIYKKFSVKNPLVFIGKDSRGSSPKLKQNLKRALLDSGAFVVDLGLCTSPFCYFAHHHFKESNGAIQITGSHNPEDYNGFKFMFQQQSLSEKEIQELYEIFVKKESLKGKGKELFLDPLPPYLDLYKKEFSFLKNIKLIVDCGNGSTGPLAEKLFSLFDISCHFIFNKPLPVFSNHHPDPTVEKNLGALKKEVLKQKADLGVAFDGDGDRIGLIDEKGTFLDGDEVCSVFIPRALKESKEKKLVLDVKMSEELLDFSKSLGGNIHICPSGHSILKKKIRSLNACFGAEFSGHVFFNDRNNFGFDDALYACLRVLEELFKTKKTLSKLKLKTFFNSKEHRIELTEKEIEEKLFTFQNELSKTPSDLLEISILDGIRATWKNKSWLLLRASNTQPVLVIRFGAQTKAELQTVNHFLKNILALKFNDD